MSLKFKQIDQIQLNSFLFTSFSCEYSEDGKIFILCDHGVYVLTLKGHIENTFPKLSFKKDLIALPDDYLIQDNLDLDLPHVLNRLSKSEIYEAILDQSLLGNVPNAAKIVPKPVTAMWSPRGIVDKTDGVLGVLTSTHNLNIFVEIIDENEISNFLCIGNATKALVDHYRQTWRKNKDLRHEEVLGELKTRVNFMIPTAFTWSHIILKDRKSCCILFIGHKDGSISAWRLLECKSCEVQESRLKFLARYKTQLETITALHWFCQKSDGGSLSVGDVHGRISALTVSKLSTDDIKFDNEVVFNTESDMKIEKIVIADHQGVTFLVGVKQSFILVYAIDSAGKVFQGKVKQVGNLYITGLLHYEDNVFLVLSACGLLKRLKFTITNNLLSINEETVNYHFDSNKYRTHGFLLSPNKVFLAVLAYPCHVKYVSKGKGFVSFVVYANGLKDPFLTLLNSSATSLRDSWDCFETLRVKCLQQKVFPWIGIPSDLNYDTLSLHKLKILRLIAKMSENIYSVITQVGDYNIKSYYHLNYAVNIKLAVQRITKLLNIHFSENKLSTFQMRSLDLLNFFLKEAVADDILTKASLGETFVDDMYAVMRVANRLRYPAQLQCIWCGEKIIGSSCIPHHIDSRCSISLMPINIAPGYKCPFCKCVVAPEMEKEYSPMFCPYCDIPMKRRIFNKLLSKGTELPADNPDPNVFSDCPNDCLGETLNDCEDNDVEYVIFSDSDTDENGSEEFYGNVRRFLTTAPTETVRKDSDSVYQEVRDSGREEQSDLEGSEPSEEDVMGDEDDVEEEETD